MPFPPGGQTDNVSRLLGNALSAKLGQQVLVDNRSGTSGTIGSAEAARAQPDGYTILMGTASSHAIGPTFRPRLQYDAVKDFAPVIAIATGPMSISVHPSVPAHSLEQLIELRFFGGLTLEETADTLGVSRRKAAKDWAAARLWLRRELTAL